MPDQQPVYRRTMHEPVVGIYEQQAFFYVLHILTAICAYGWAYCTRQYLQIASDFACPGEAQLYDGLAKGILILALLLWFGLIFATFGRWKRVSDSHAGKPVLLLAMSSFAPPVYFLLAGHVFVYPSAYCV